MKRAIARQLLATWRPLGWLADGWLQRAGDVLQRRQDVIRRIQWLFVGVYYFLLIVPAILPQPTSRAEVFSSLAGWAEIVFWGIWWPGIILSMMLFGQFWCGVFCPDGALTEKISRHGRGGKIPGWVRWSGWPLLAFSVVLVYEQLLDAYRMPQLILVSLGGASLLALLCGYFFGRGKRVWCRYLCPASSLFSLLARCAIFHFKVDRAAWDAAPKPLPRAVDCPPLLDVRRLRSNEKCSMCGRCSGHRNAVVLAARAPGGEIVSLDPAEIRPADAFAICALLIGLCYGAVHGRDGLLAGILRAAGWSGSGLVLFSILLTALFIGSSVALMLWWAGGRRPVVACHLAYGLIPLAGCGLFLGALEHGFQLLKEAGFSIGFWGDGIRLFFVFGGALWSLYLSRLIVQRWYAQSTACYRVVHGLLLLFLCVLYQFTP